jgi:hypothetical protein
VDRLLSCNALTACFSLCMSQAACLSPCLPLLSHYFSLFASHRLPLTVYLTLYASHLVALQVWELLRDQLLSGATEEVGRDAEVSQ